MSTPPGRPQMKKETRLTSLARDGVLASGRAWAGRAWRVVRMRVGARPAVKVEAREAEYGDEEEVVEEVGGGALEEEEVVDVHRHDHFRRHLRRRPPHAAVLREVERLPQVAPRVHADDGVGEAMEEQPARERVLEDEQVGNSQRDDVRRDARQRRRLLEGGERLHAVTS